MTTFAAAAGVVSTGEAWGFWILGPLAVIGALGMVIARNAVHSALWLVVTMLCLGFIYVMNSAPFLGAVQIIVYTGAIMMLFLFVLMLVGRDASDSLIETLRGQRVAAIAARRRLRRAWSAPGWPGRSAAPTSVGLTAANANGNVQGLARAAVHPVRLRVRGHLGAADHGGGRRDGDGPRRARQGRHGRPGHPDDARASGRATTRAPKPGPGVYANTMSVAAPARLPDGNGVRAQHLADPAGP